MAINPYMINPTNGANPYQAVGVSPQFYAPPTPSVPSSKFGWAMGEAGAQAYPVQPGETVAIFDSTAPILRMKTVGQDGKPLEMEVYDLVKREVSEATKEKDPIEEFVTKDEIKTLVSSSVKEEVDKAISELSLKPTPKKKKGADE